MSASTNYISVKYSDDRLRVLVEDYITMQKSKIPFEGVCSYVLYWAMEEGEALQGNALHYESDKMSQEDSARVLRVLDQISREGRISACGKHYVKLTY